MRNPLVMKEVDLHKTLEAYQKILKEMIQGLKAPSLEVLNQKMKSGEKLSKD